MNKRALIKKIIARLTEELKIYFRAAQFSRAEATHESSESREQIRYARPRSLLPRARPVQAGGGNRSRHRRI
ncbi:MAG: hypothetical protein WDM76_19855 [Limisphaerales bacterium]